MLDKFFQNNQEWENKTLFSCFSAKDHFSLSEIGLQL